ncbi:DUF4178 domain-containing protein [Comamonas sp. NLF-1-9]|uniref:DUF4178 domain-containing protein n=1 Tax=Comamonas sp. NLF-1-9 TaxID=2853163 RepID=UPI001C4520A8|nr:DUF4178 domain-containing protein [Comamonas sp. NLF-1-9]QXL84003.1 DUF4178 domain-containing protein [Comamonas sp. NLF-1-9]
MATSQQRHYSAPCPGCGAPVEFLSAQSSYAVCGYCHSTVVRRGDVLARVGKMAELFEDHSPLQLMASGKWEGIPFTLIGRMQFRGAQGGWTEWNAWLDDGRRATLGEDNGAYVFTQPLQPPPADLPAPEQLGLGASLTLAGRRWSVAAYMQAHLAAAEGELPKLPPPGQEFLVVELRSDDGQVLSIDYGGKTPQLEIGRSVQLADLQLKGLKDNSSKQEQGRHFNCPHCGAPVQVQLQSTKSITCGSCHSLIDLSGGIGAELLSATQQAGAPPLIALGSVGQFEGVPWQVVGYQRRLGQEPDDDEQFAWDEYLLYNQQKGFTFLVDASDGWSLVRPATGAPKLGALGAAASYLGMSYVRSSGYRATTDYVAGEFYWPVERGQQTDNVDYAATQGKGILSREQSDKEITWSYGNRLASSTVAQAFGREAEADKFKRDEVGPFVASGGSGCGLTVLVFIVLIMLVITLSTCTGGSSSSGSYNRSSGGSFGGYSSGGSHK